ncbi:MAG: aspartate--tRNA(Asn) ligase, partial [Minisyncoccia bacterium]
HGTCYFIPVYMAERVLMGELSGHIGKTVSIAGFVDVRRDQGKLVFFDFRDRSGAVQGVVLPASPAMEAAKEVRTEYVVQVEGMVNKRPEKNSVDRQNGDIELSIQGIEILSRAEELPFDKDTDLTIDTRFDYRPYTLRSQRDRDIFSVQATILDAYRNSLKRQGFTEFVAPALVGGDAEGGSAVFSVGYYNDKTAYLATSPQLYKQIMVGAFERVFTIAKIFRAEKSATTRHLSELTQMDFEMGFIQDEFDVMAVLEQTVRDVVLQIGEKHSAEFSRLGAQVPHVGVKFPILTLAEAHQTLGVAPEDDMTPEHERAICEWALKEHQCDFVFITKFPTAARAFYTRGESKGLSRGFDLLFRGLEINSGAERIHDYTEMVERIKERGMDPKKFSFYLQAFKYGMPPHGGCSTGLERFTARMLNLANVKEASAFPRDMHRIDILLSNPVTE